MLDPSTTGKSQNVLLGLLIGTKGTLGRNRFGSSGTAEVSVDVDVEILPSAAGRKEVFHSGIIFLTILLGIQRHPRKLRRVIRHPSEFFGKVFRT